MDSIKDDALSALAFLDDLAFDLDVPFVSSVTGDTTSQLDSAYWWANIRRPVLFSKGDGSHPEGTQARHRAGGRTAQCTAADHRSMSWKTVFECTDMRSNTNEKHR